MPIDAKEGSFNQSKDRIKEPIENQNEEPIESPDNFPTEEAEDRQPINYDKFDDKEKPTDKEQKKEARKARRLLTEEKIRLILEDKDCKQAFYAFLRTLANLGIGVVDAFPGIGELPSWAADAVKILKVARAKNIEGKKKENPPSKDSKEDEELKNFWKKLDTSPDVSIGIATVTEGLDAILGTGLPSHLLFETPLQFKADYPRIKEGLKKIKEIMGAKTIEELQTMAGKELRDYQENQSDIDQALETFTS
jgi:hypothetical protein